MAASAIEHRFAASGQRRETPHPAAGRPSRRRMTSASARICGFSTATFPDCGGAKTFDQFLDLALLIDPVNHAARFGAQDVDGS